MCTLSQQASATTQADSELYRLRLLGCAWVFLFQCLLMTLPTLKLLHLFGVDAWSWRWVTLPFWGPGVLLALVLLGERATGLRKADSQVTLSYLARF
ncbi:MAG: hypothetical protein EOO55_00980 [Hymenobacter sp.]|nr:MAG: hypothetical protein EOO55_00980 [Hymenobacter sp.]